MAQANDTLPETFPQEVQDAYEWFYGEGRLISGDYRAYMENTNRNLAVLTDFANEQADAGELVGQIVSYPVADGQALYMVTSEKPLYLAHIAFGDGYQIPAAHLRGLWHLDVRSRWLHHGTLTASGSRGCMATG